MKKVQLYRETDTYIPMQILDVFRSGLVQRLAPTLFNHIRRSFKSLTLFATGTPLDKILSKEEMTELVHGMERVCMEFMKLVVTEGHTVKVGEE